MRVEKIETSVKKYVDLTKPQGDLPASSWAEGRVGYARVAASVMRRVAPRSSPRATVAW